MLDEKYQNFYDQIIKKIDKKKIFTDKLHTIAYGTDASFYRLIPKIVIKADNANEVLEIVKLSDELELSITFRAAGTSLSGQAISDSILVVTSRNFTDFKIADDKSYITLQPSLIGAQVNSILAPFGKKIGPDPASISTAMIGGIAANNASGMCCGVSQNSYKTMKSIKLIFANGSRLDTACSKSKEDFRKENSEFLNNLKKLSDETKADESLRKLIQRKYKIKNTCGYSLNALIDFDDVFDILSHLIIGSEGTLGFIEEITYYTVEELKDKASALVYFKDMHQACSAVTKLKLSRDSSKIIVDAVELMDRGTLKSIENKEFMPEFIKEFHDDVTALLIETRATSDEKLDIQINQILDLLKEFEVEKKPFFTKKPQEYNLYWQMRKELLPAVGEVRKNGTSVITEDVAFPIKHLANASLDLQALFKKHGYHEASILGHALEGNLHFLMTQDFSIQSELDRYDAFMNEVVEIVTKKYKGSLKAEHGTGRNMASFVEIEWGEKAYNLMKKVKKLYDPKNLLNPGVVLNEDKEIHLKNLKTMPETNDIIDKCIECGFCEPSCPSNAVTLTPRERIVISRYIMQLKSENKLDEAKELEELYEYDGVDTCATCSMCSTTCPIKIDTGNLTKYLRSENLSQSGKKIASFVANNFDSTLKGVRFGLHSTNFIHKVLGTASMQSVTKTFRELSFNKSPKWSTSMPKAISIDLNFEQKESSKKVVYFPSCINRSMGLSSVSKEEKQLFDVTVELLQKADYQILFPKNLSNLCCGMPFSSKGFNESANLKSKELEKELLSISNNGEYPILCDTSPCTKMMMEKFENKELSIFEPIEFALEFLTNELEFKAIDEPITIHTTCSSRKMGLEDKFKILASMCSHEVIVPADIKCCGFAGDRGFNFPELNESALRTLKTQVKDAKYAFSTSKTCEIGLSSESGLDYNSIFYLVNQVTEAKNL